MKSAMRRMSASFADKQEDKELGDLEMSTVRKGYLWKKGGGKRSSAWKQRWCILTRSQVLYYCKSPQDAPRGQLTIAGYKVEEFTNTTKPCAFQLVPPGEEGRTFYFCCVSEDDKKGWMSSLSSLADVIPFNPKAHRASQMLANKIEQKLKGNAYEIRPEELEWCDTKVTLKGGSSIVKKALWLETTEVAAKSLDTLNEYVDPDELGAFFQEIELLSQLRHPNILTMYGYCKKLQTVFLITEFVKGGNLHDIVTNLAIKFDPLAIGISIVKGMVYLHSKNVIHRDLKPENILVESVEASRVKVCDFGLSRVLRNNFLSVSVSSDALPSFGTPEYAAPELPSENHTNKVDVFSFAVILWEMFTRQVAWKDEPQPWFISERVEKGERPSPMPTNCSCEDLIRRCWDVDPNKRPSFLDVFKEMRRIQNGGIPVNEEELL